MPYHASQNTIRVLPRKHHTMPYHIVPCPNSAYQVQIPNLQTNTQSPIPQHTIPNMNPTSQPTNPAPNSRLQTIPHTLPHLLLKRHRIIPPLPRRLDIRRALVVGTAQHADNGEEDGRGCLDGGPAFRGGFVACAVFFGRVEDGDADGAVCEDCFGGWWG